VKLVLDVVLLLSPSYVRKDPVLSIAKISMNVLSFLVYAVTAGARTLWEVLRVNVVKDTLWTNLEFVVLISMNAISCTAFVATESVKTYPEVLCASVRTVMKHLN